MYCKDCKHWERGFHGYDTSKPSHTGNCNSGKFVYQGELIDGVNYEDAECYGAVCETGELFGCIHFKPVGIPERDP